MNLKLFTLFALVALAFAIESPKAVEEIKENPIGLPKADVPAPEEKQKPVPVNKDLDTEDSVKNVKQEDAPVKKVETPIGLASNDAAEKLDKPDSILKTQKPEEDTATSKSTTSTTPSTTTNKTTSTSTTSTTPSTTTNKTTTSSTTTTTVSPPTPPPPAKVAWNVTDENGVSCFLANFSIDLAVQWKNTSALNLSPATRTFTFNASTASMVTDKSGCFPLFNQITLINDKEPLLKNLTPYSITLRFDNSSSKYFLSNITGSLDLNSTVLYPDMSNSTQRPYSLASKNLTFFKTPIGQSYQCINGREMAPLLASDNVTVTVTFYDVRLQSFMSSEDNGQFGEANLCPDDFTTSNIVPIAVGIALACLVGIVLVAYVIGRRRNRARGYESM